MPGRIRYTSEEIIEAYKSCGSVWAAAKKLGVSGQVVWEKLRSLDYPMSSRKWSGSEIGELKVLAETCAIGEIARRIGRPYAGVALKLSRLNIHVPRQRTKKIPRGAGFDKQSVRKHMKALDAYAKGITHYCRSNSLTIDLLVLAIQREDLEWWDRYSARHTDISKQACAYCARIFYPMNARQKACSRPCQTAARVDRTYFAGNRKSTIGLAEGVCQLCEKQGAKGLSSHHVLGKENDPEGTFLVALCPGCHQIVGRLAGRTFVDTNEGWENLINLVMLRRSEGKVPGYLSTVEVEALTEEDFEDEE